MHTAASTSAAALNPDKEAARVSACKGYLGGLVTSGTFAVARYCLQFSRTGVQRLLKDPSASPMVRRGYGWW